MILSNQSIGSSMAQQREQGALRASHGISSTFSAAHDLASETAVLGAGRERIVESLAKLRDAIQQAAVGHAAIALPGTDDIFISGAPLRWDAETDESLAPDQEDVSMSANENDDETEGVIEPVTLSESASGVLRHDEPLDLPKDPSAEWSSRLHADVAELTSRSSTLHRVFAAILLRMHNAASLTTHPFGREKRWFNVELVKQTRDQQVKLGALPLRRVKQFNRDLAMEAYDSCGVGRSTC